MRTRKQKAAKALLDGLHINEINVPLLDRIAQAPKHEESLKKLCTNKLKLAGTEKVNVSKDVSALLQKRIPTNARMGKLCYPLSNWDPKDQQSTL